MISVRRGPYLGVGFVRRASLVAMVLAHHERRFIWERPAAQVRGLLGDVVAVLTCVHRKRQRKTLYEGLVHAGGDGNWGRPDAAPFLQDGLDVAAAPAKEGGGT